MFDLMQYALIFYDFQLILAQMGQEGPFALKRNLECYGLTGPRVKPKSG